MGRSVIHKLSHSLPFPPPIPDSVGLYLSLNTQPQHIRGFQSTCTPAPQNRRRPAPTPVAGIVWQSAPWWASGIDGDRTWTNWVNSTFGQRPAAYDRDAALTQKGRNGVDTNAPGGICVVIAVAGLRARCMRVPRTGFGPRFGASARGRVGFGGGGA